MLDKHQKQSKEKLQVKFHQFMNKFMGGLKLPERKNVLDICLGIIKTQSVIGNQVAQSLQERIPLKKTCERIYRNLRKIDLCDTIQHNILTEYGKKIDANTAM